MKKLRFKELCQDKNTGMYYKRGDVVEFEDARALEIMQHNVAEIVEEKETETVEEPKEEKPKRGRKPKAEQDK